MSWKYTLGRAGNNLLEGWLRTQSAGTRYFPAGICWPFDALRLCRRKGLTCSMVFDVGANVGQTALSFCRWFPDAQIHSFEPVPETFRILETKVSRYPRIRCHPIALGDRNGVKQIRLMRDSELNTLVDEPALSSEATDRFAVVAITTVADFCEKEQIRQIDILKLDTQGYEVNVLTGARDLLRRTAFVLAEVGLQGQRVDMSSFAAVHDYLRSSGFLFCGLYDSFRHWETKLLVSFANALYVNTAHVENQERVV